MIRKILLTNECWPRHGKKRDGPSLRADGPTEGQIPGRPETVMVLTERETMLPVRKVHQAEEMQ